MRPAALAILLVTMAESAAAAAPSIDGAWDLTWQTRKGPSPGGYLLIRHDGPRLIAEIHGKGAVTATGSESGGAFRFHGTRMLVGYTISGTWSGNAMQGRWNLLSVEKAFVGHRRPAATRP